MSARVISMCAAAAAICIAALVTSSDRVGAQGGCTTLNPITCENQNPGNPASEWDISGAGDASIQGFATNISIAAGQPVSFKIKTTASAYTIDIYRMGYYSGMGARKVAAIAPSATLPQVQPACLTQSTTGLIDCGNWGVSASWTVPAAAVSGIYFAKLTRTDTGGASHIVFVVRDDVRHSDLLFQTSDTTWQAYNTYGGNSLYSGAPGTNPARAYKVSYNRPFATRDNSAQDFVFNAEYPMVRWLEANGYDVTYATGIDSDRNGANLLNHKALVTVGHDEYWSGGQRANFEAARAAGVHLAFFSGNEIFWKTRWENSIDGSNTPNRTLVCYKETHANAVLDPADPPTWTGTWADPRFSPPADGGRPQNALTGTYFQVNDGNTTSISVPAAMGKLRFWRNTSVANLTGSQTATLPVGTLGYEWDADLDNGFRPAGLMRLSQTTANVTGKLLDWGSSYGAGTVTHALTLYRHSSGALVFGAGTVQWSWGLDANHDRAGTPADVRMQQATVNLFADMGAQPLTLQAGLVGTAASPDALAPTSSITSPAAGSAFVGGAPVTISGTATENGGGTVTVVEVSTDGGTTWRQATGTTSWSYSWNATGSGTVTLKSRAFDDSGNAETPSAGVSITVTLPACPCSVMNAAATPAVLDDTDAHATSLGMRFRSDASGYVTGVRFYKGTIVNSGTHVGHLWTNTGTLLGSVTFTSETSTGWQQANFASAIPISANTTYVISYYAPSGHYSSTPSLFGTAGVDNAPLHALRDGVDGANGVYLWNSDGFPISTFSSEHYWVDVVFNTVAPPDTTAPTVSSVTPAASALLVDPTVVVTATFSEAMDPSTISSSTTGAEGGASSLGTFELRDPQNNLIPATVTYDAASRTASLRAAAPLSLSTTYTALVKGGGADPRVKDLAGNALAANMTWSFTTASAPPPAQTGINIWGSTVPNPADDGDPNSVELGTKFRSDVAGVVTGARFYKAPLNTGTHTATLWTATGTQLAAATFTSESASGWQQVAFASPVSIAANTTYLISYHAPNGHYSAPDSYLAASGVDNPPLHALKNGIDGPNGVYIYSTTRTFPTQTYLSEAYFVDVVFTANGGPDTTPPTIATYSPANAATGIPTTTGVSVAFSEAMDQTTITTANIKLLDSTGSVVPSTIAYSSGSLSATLTPASALAYSSTYSGVVTTGVKDFSGNAMASNFTWTFTTSAPPPPPPIQGPGGPILVVTSTANAFTTYYAEILRGEGANLFATQDISQVTAATLSGYDAVILGEVPLTTAQVTMFTNWVTGGGSLIAMRPDKQLAGLLGLTDASATLSNAYLLMNTASGPGKGLVAQTIQFHGAADRYTLSGATSLATLYSNATTATANPAVTLRTVGAGLAAAFTFDLARSVVYTRQGNPAWSGQERDGQVVIRSDDLFFGAKTGDIQPDWIDLTKVAIPQADEQQRFLWNILLSVTSSKKPLPRFWYFPRMLKAAVVMTGDDHANGGTAGRFDDYINFSPANCNVANWECVRGTSYIYPTTPFTNAAAAGYLAQGFEIALHVNTDCADWTPSTLPTFYSSQLSQFASAYPSVPAPRTNRTHCIAWSDYDTQPQVELANGIRLDTSYYYWPAAWIQDRPGMFTGSGMPQRFTKINGTMIDVYQATSQMTDESGQTFPKNIDALLDGAVGAAGYYGAFTANMHTDFNGNAVETESNQIVTSALARGVPVITAKQLLDWVDGRNGSAFQNLSWNGNQLNFTISAGQGANGIRTLIPATFGASPLTGISLNGVAVSYTLETIKGVQYAVFGGVGSAVASYGADVTPPAIGAIAATTTSSSATVTWTTNELSDSIVSYGTSPSNLTQTITDAALVASHSVTIPGLAASATYYYVVSSADAAANRSTAPATPASFTTAGLSIAGTITPLAGGSGAIVTLSGPLNRTATANASGQYSFANLASGTYTVSAAKTGYTMSAPSSVTLTTASVANVNFTAQAIVITGTVTPASIGAGATVTLSGTASATTTADAQGNYTFSALANGSYTVTPAKAGNVFTPANAAVTVSGSSVTGVNFTGQALPTFSISGTITPSSLSAGATVTLSGAASGTTAVNASGGYTFSGLLNGTYTITPSKPGAAFSPASSTVTVTNGNVSANFTAASVGPAIDVSVWTDRGPGTTVTSPAFSTAAPNELLLALVAADNAQAAATTVTSVTGGGLTWVLVGRTNAQRGTAEIWRAFAPATLTSVTVAAAISQNVSSSITVMSFTGVDTTGTSGAGAIGAIGGASAASGAPTATLTTTRANSFVVGVGVDWDNAVARTLGPGQIMVHQVLATNGDTYWVQRTTNVVPAIGTVVTINDTAPTADRYNLTICEVRSGG